MENKNNKLKSLAGKRQGLMITTAFGSILAIGLVGIASGVPAKVECSSEETPVSGTRCTTTTNKITLRAPVVNGAMDFENANQIVVNVTGRSESGDLNSVQVVSQGQLPGGGSASLSRGAGGVLVITPATPKSPVLTQKNPVVIVGKDSGVNNLTVDLSGKVAGQNAGNAVIVADSINSIAIDARGYSGRSGEDVRTSLALAAAAGGAGKVPPAIANSFINSRTSNASAPLTFTQSDLNNYSASGLSCAAGETPVGPAGTLAGAAAIAAGGSPQTSINVTAFQREEKARAFCQRDPEFSMTQGCAPEKEYSFQATCRVNTETRDMRLYQRDPVIWQRKLCTGNLNTQVRRGVTRQADVQIATASGKVYRGLLATTTTFEEIWTYLDAAWTMAPNGSTPHPFLQQNIAIDPTSSLKVVSTPKQLPNGSGGTITGTSVPNKNRVLYLTKQATSNSTSAVNKLTVGPLFDFAPTTPGQTPPQLSYWARYVTGTGTGNDLFVTQNTCAPILNRQELLAGLRNSIGTGRRSNAETALKSIDVSPLGITNAELADPATSVIATNCIAYEVIEEIAAGEVIKAPWYIASGNVSGLRGSPVPGSTPEVFSFETGALPPTTPQACSPEFNEIGTETYVAFQDPGTCYVEDPRSPPAAIFGVDGTSGSFIPSSDLSTSQLLNKNWKVLNGVTSAAASVSTPISHEFIGGAAAGITSQSDFKKWCVVPGNTPLTGSIISTTDYSVRAALAPATLVPGFTLDQSTNLAIPKAGDYVCLGGIRLDSYLSVVQRPTCPAGTSTGLKLLKPSSEYSDLTWAPWTNPTKASQINANSLLNHSLYNRIEESRYAGLPLVATTPTHMVDGAATQLTNTQSITGAAFPPDYGFSTGSGAFARRTYDGWLREGDLVTFNGGSISPSSFIPYRNGVSTQDRGNNWCSANAFEAKNGSILRSFGAKGALREPPKRIFSMNIDGAAYVGIELVNPNEIASFGNLDSGSVFTFGSQTGDTVTPWSPINPASGGGGAQALKNIDVAGNQAALLSFFNKTRYPYLRSAFEEDCASQGLTKSGFGGYCYQGGSVGVPRTRVPVLTRNPLDLEGPIPWSVDYATLNPSLVTGTFDSTALPLLMGQFRSTAKIAQMAQLTTIPGNGSVILTRPESAAGNIPMPGLYTYKNQLTTAQAAPDALRVLLVPAASATSFNPNDLIGTPNLPDGSKLLALEFTPAAGGTLVVGSGAVVFTLSGGAVTSTGSNLVNITTLPGGGLRLIGSGGQSDITISNVIDTYVSGVSATTGGETLSMVELRPPVLRDRAAEWASTGRTSQSLAWQGMIRTAPSDTTSNLTAPPRSCVVRTGNTFDLTGVQNGSWGASTNGVALSQEELGLFTRPVPNTTVRTVTRPAATQWTPWSDELVSGSAKDGDYTTSANFGSWTILDGTQSAPVPDCSVFNGGPGVPDATLSKTIASIPGSLKSVSGSDNIISNPLNSSTQVLRYSTDATQARSDTCTRWDSVNGRICESFEPSIGAGSIGSSMTFGGTWKRVYVEKRERVSQNCTEFYNGGETYVDAGGATRTRLPTECKTVVAKGPARNYTCTPTSCDLPTNIQSFQVEAATPVNGNPGEDGTNGGSAIIFVRNVTSYTFDGRAGVGGLGSSPVSSDRSQTLTCMSTNNNPLNPQVSVRNLWSQPFVGGNAGSNGRSGTPGEGAQIFTDMSPEAIWQISQPDFWVK